MKLYFVRHGESEANLLNEISNRGLKHGLTDKGRQQSAALAQKLKGIPIAELFSSPLLRAVQTAEILARELDVPYEITDALREFDCGILEGKSDEASWDIWRAVWHDWDSGRWDSRIEQGESLLDIKERFAPFIEHLVEEYQHSSEDIVLVGHGGTYCRMLPLVLTNVDSPRPYPNTGYVVAEMRPEGLVCLAWCETTIPSS